MIADWFQVAHEVMQTGATLILAATIWRLQNEVRSTTTNGER